jgi:hypothetical protein
MKRRLALAACSLLCAAPALALDLPPRKAGLWDIKMTFVGRPIPPQTTQHCIDEKTDKLMNANYGGMRMDSCPKHDMKNEGGKIMLESVCKFGSMTTTSNAVFSGNFDESYQIAISTTMSPPQPGTPPGPMQMAIEAKYVGACKAGQKPGDIVLQNGVKMNVLEMPGAKKP